MNHYLLLCVGKSGEFLKCQLCYAASMRINNVSKNTIKTHFTIAHLGAVVQTKVLLFLCSVVMKQLLAVSSKLMRSQTSDDESKYGPTQ